MMEIFLHNKVDFGLSEIGLKNVVGRILADHGIHHGEVSLAVVDDPTMHELNRRHLQHDYPTDVLSFVLAREDDVLDGEVIVSADTATNTAAEHGWSAEAELMLYFVHGCLHLVGYDDRSDEDRLTMRKKELHYLSLSEIHATSDYFENHFERDLRPEQTSP